MNQITGLELKALMERNNIDAYELAKKLKVTAPTVYNWLKRDKLDFITSVAIQNVLKEK